MRSICTPGGRIEELLMVATSCSTRVMVGELCSPRRHAVGNQLVEIDLELRGLGLAAPAGHVDRPGDGTEAALQHPVLQRLEVKHAVIRRTLQPVAVDFTDRADRRNARLYVAWQ